MDAILCERLMRVSGLDCEGINVSACTAGEADDSAMRTSERGRACGVRSEN